MFIVNVEGAIYKDNKWLIGKRSEKEDHAANTLSLIGGKVEQEGNTDTILETTLRREITEEVGISVKHPIYITSASFVTDTGIHVVNIVYLCEHQSGEAIVKDPNEIAAVYWMTTEEIIHGSTIPEYVKAYIKQADRLKQKVITKTEKTFET